jgi:hypothetical protein
LHATHTDEELGGECGMKVWINTDEYKRLNVGFHADEGLASPNDTYLVYNAERCPLSAFAALTLPIFNSITEAKVTCTGNPGHGSMFIENTAAEKLVCESRRTVYSEHLRYSGVSSTSSSTFAARKNAA